MKEQIRSVEEGEDKKSKSGGREKLGGEWKGYVGGGAAGEGE